MLQRVMHVFLGTIFVVFASVQAVQAVSFGKVVIASKMDEPFYAEVPLRLSEGEILKKASVELGGAADYRILEVYRNKVLNLIRTDIDDDERGPRVTLTSDTPINSAFFNIVLKVRYGRSTHYKKIPVFLDVTTKITSANDRKITVGEPVDAANVVLGSSEAYATKDSLRGSGDKQAFQEPVDFPQLEKESSISSSFEAFDSWARTSRYGPMIYGDTIGTVARRLRVDDQFSQQQVMMALFEKNREKFEKDNINIIKAGTYLNVPSANEVSRFTTEESKQMLAEQTRAWKAMQKQPKYAALAEAQRTRYSSRVRIGQGATGEPKKPALVEQQSTEKEKVEVVAEPVVDTKATDELKGKLLEKDEQLTELQQKMANLTAKLEEADAKVEEANAQAEKANNAPAELASASSAALEAQNKRLELVITRLKSELEEAKEESTPAAPRVAGIEDWMINALGGLGLLMVSLLAAIFVLMRKNRRHPSDRLVEDPMLEEEVEEIEVEAFETVEETPAAVDESEEELDATELMSADDFDMPADVDLEELDASKETFGAEEAELDGIPDLTDEETGEIEPFNASDEVPDPNVNYLEDAEVYIRYGMEDEAEKQVKMALKLQEDNPDAHIKMVQIQKAKGDKESITDAINTAKAVLAGDALAIFDKAFSDEPKESETPEEEIGLDSGTVDFGEFTMIVQPKEESDSETSEDFDFDFGEVGKADAEESSTDVSADEGVEMDAIEASISGKLDSIEMDMESIEMPIFETEEEIPEVIVENQSDEATLVTGVELDDSLNDHEIEKALAEAEAEKNAASVELDMAADDIFSTASVSLEEEENLQISNDLDEGEMGALEGEKEDELSLSDSSVETGEIELVDLEPEIETDEPAVLLDSVSGDLDLESLNIDFDDAGLGNTNEEVKAEVEPESVEIDFEASFDGLDDIGLDTMGVTLGDDKDIVADDEPMNLDDAMDDIGLDSLEMDFELPDVESELDALEANVSSIVTDTTKIDASADINDELDMTDIDIGAIDIDSSLASEENDFDSTVIINNSDKEALLATVKQEQSHFSNIDNALEDSTMVLDKASNPMANEFSATAELSSIERTLDSLKESENDPMVETFGSSAELDDLMKDLDGLLNEDKNKK